MTDVVAIASGLNHCLALKRDGTVWSWGSNYKGQIGDRTLTARTFATRVPSISGIVAISAGNEHSLAIQVDGLGTTTTRKVPISVLSGVVRASAGFGYSLVTTADGTILGVGDNEDGKIGNGSTANQPVFAPTYQLPDVREVTAGGANSFATT